MSISDCPVSYWRSRLHHHWNARWSSIFDRKKVYSNFYKSIPITAYGRCKVAHCIWVKVYSALCDGNWPSFTWAPDTFTAPQLNTCCISFRLYVPEVAWDVAARHVDPHDAVWQREALVDGHCVRHAVAGVQHHARRSTSGVPGQEAARAGRYWSVTVRQTGLSRLGWWAWKRRATLPLPSN